MKLRAHGRMDAVGADQDVALRSGRSGEVRDHAIGILIEADQPMADVHRRFAHPLDGRLIEQPLQLAAMDRELRPGVARVQAARLGPDALAEAVAVDQLAGPDAGRVQAFQQPQLGKLLDRVGQKVDAHAELANPVGLLENLDLDALLEQAERRAEAADAATDHERLHRSSRAAWADRRSTSIGAAARWGKPRAVARPIDAPAAAWSLWRRGRPRQAA